MRRLRGALGIGTIWGVAGTTVGLLVMAERRRTVAPWTVLPAGRALVLLMAASGSYGAVGAALAAGTVWAARQAPEELPPRPMGENGSRLGPPARSP